MSETADFAVIGGGIVGLATALRLQAAVPGSRVMVLEKEPSVAQHQSGRNSSVIHAGVYYKPGSLKARFCRAGVAATEAFCREHGIRFETTGKMIVATDEGEVERMNALAERARQNGIAIEPVDGQALAEAEPNIRGVAAIFSPNTGIVDYAEITAKLAERFAQAGGAVIAGLRVLGGEEGPSGVHLRTTGGDVSCDRVVACAGLQSDRLVAAFGQRPDFRIVPFRGEYFRLVNQPPDLIGHLIYPVPDPKRPFLGVHLTRKLDGGFTVGPNAVLAFAREGYEGQISVGDTASTLSYPGFWRMLAGNLGPAVSELAASASKRLYLKRVQRYCPRVGLGDFAPYRPGIRAQAISPSGALIDDFHFFQTERCLHVGNAPSPGATAAFPIAEHVVSELLA